MALALRKTWSTKDPERLQKELQELQRGIIDELARLGARTRVRPSTQDTVFAGYDDVVRLSPTSAGQQLVLPAAVPARAGATVEAIIESADGAVTVEAVDSLVNEEESITFVARIGRALFSCNGSGWFLATMLPSGFITSADILDGTIVNADISASAAIALTKMAPIADDSMLVNISGGAATAAERLLTDMAGDGLAYDAANHHWDVTGSTSITITSDQVQRAALTGAISASANSNSTLFSGITDNGVSEADRATLNFQNSTTNTALITDSGGELQIEYRRAALTGAITASANSNATLFAGIRDNGSAETDRTNLNFVNSTSCTAVVTDDAGNDELEVTFQRAALTGEVTASANANTTTITRSTNFDWTGEHSYAESATGPTLAAGQGAFWPLNEAPTTPMYTDDAGLTWRIGCAAVQAITANTAATNATTNLSGGSFAIPAGSSRVGTLYRNTLAFLYTHTAATTPTLTAELLIAGAVAQTVVFTPLAFAATFYGEVVAITTIRSLGAGGTCMVSAQFKCGIANSLGDALAGAGTVATTAIDTTASQTIELRIRMTTAVASNTLTVIQGFTERLR